jgi:Co/Zn/Cd efflux system component
VTVAAARSQGENPNTRAAFLEVVNDALNSAAALVAAVVIAAHRIPPS